MSERRPWYVLRCKPQSEIEAEKQIRRLGYDTIVPYKMGFRRVRGNNRPWKWALFPGYLFASWLDWATGWRRIASDDKDNPDRIASIYGFLHPIWMPTPYVLPPADVEYLQSIADGKYKPAEDTSAKWNVGDPVLIPEGPFQGRVGTITKVHGKKATIAIKGEKNVLSIEIAIANLEKV
jgi:transcription antitermination factor NusG